MTISSIGLDKAFFQGVISVECGEGWMQPWRLPCDRLDYFPGAEAGLIDRARYSSGVRLRVETDSRVLALDFFPLSKHSVTDAHQLDLTLDNAIISTVTVPPGGESAVFENLPAGRKVVEVWLPQGAPIRLRGLSVEEGCMARPAEDKRPRWVTYGSSLTHCVRANSSARIWPAVVSRAMNWNLTSLGYGGCCLLEPMVGMMIRDLPADLITLKLGINGISGSLPPRTFPAAVMGLVCIIREKHPHTPMALISPIAYPPHETKPNMHDYTISGMRRDIEDVYRRLKARGDENIYYFNGLELFNEAEIAEYASDQCHPNGDGIELMGAHFLERFVPKLPLARG